MYSPVDYAEIIIFVDRQVVKVSSPSAYMKKVILCIRVCFCNDSLLARLYELLIYFGDDSAVEARYAEVDTVHNACAYNVIYQFLCIIRNKVKSNLCCLGIFFYKFYDRSFIFCEVIRVSLVHSVVELECGRKYVKIH